MERCQLFLSKAGLSHTQDFKKILDGRQISKMAMGTIFKIQDGCGNPSEESELCWAEKIVGTSKKLLGPNEILGLKKSMVPKKMLGPTNFLGPEKNYGS